MMVHVSVAGVRRKKSIHTPEKPRRDEREGEREGGELKQDDVHT